MQVHDTTNNRVTAELIFTGGKVHTVTARNDIVEAVAVGVPVAGSSDAPVTHYTPLFGIEQALTRKTMAGRLWSRRVRGLDHSHLYAHHQRRLRIV